MSKRSPAYQYYPDKYVAHTNHLSDYAYRIYHRLLNWMWLHSSDYFSCPHDDGAIAVLLAEPFVKIETAMKEIQNPHMPLLKVHKDTLVSNGLKKERKKQEDRRKINSDNAKKRWHSDLTPMQSHSDGYAKPMPKPCSPSPSPIPSPSPSSSPAPHKRDSVDWKEVETHWNTLATANGIPTIRPLSDARKRQFKTRLQSHPDFWTVLDAEIPLLDDFSKTFVTFPWLIKSGENMDKLAEGNYRDRADVPIDKEAAREAELHEQAVEIHRRTGQWPKIGDKL